MISDPRFPKGYQIPAEVLFVCKTLPSGGLAVKVHVVVEGLQYYLILDSEGLATGELWTLAEVTEACSRGYS